MSVMIVKGYQNQFPLHFPYFTGIFFAFFFMILIERMPIITSFVSGL